MNTHHTWSDSPIHDQIRNMDSPTPRTNDAQFGTGRVSVEFAKTLERELTIALAEIDRLDVAGIHSCHSECQKSNCVLRRELATVTEQRDEARETLAELRASLTTKR